jgi:hypothetical protein
MKDCNRVAGVLARMQNSPEAQDIEAEHFTFPSINPAHTPSLYLQ